MKRISRTLKEIRLEHNRDVLQRLKSGDSLQSFDSIASWFPARPVIQKDATAITKLYGQKAQDLSSITATFDPVVTIAHLVQDRPNQDGDEA
jgi:hypothetical protein